MYDKLSTAGVICNTITGMAEAWGQGGHTLGRIEGTAGQRRHTTLLLAQANFQTLANPCTMILFSKINLWHKKEERCDFKKAFNPLCSCAIMHSEPTQTFTVLSHLNKGFNMLNFFKLFV